MTASKFGWSVGALLSLGLVCSACGGTSTSSTPTPKPTPTSKIDDPITLCEPGTQRCDGQVIKRCNAKGTGETIELTCSKGQRCDEHGGDPFCNSPAAAVPVCAANQAVCDGNIASQCKADGSGPEPFGVDCAARKQHCLNGACSDALCIGGSKGCQNGDVYLCSLDGSSLSVWDYCAEGELCDEDSGSCLTRRCEPNQASCQGTRALICNASGSDWLPGSSDCAAEGKVCVAGSCAEAPCAPSTTFCQDGNLYRCDPSGASSTLAQTCRPGLEHCEKTPAGLYAFCVPYACVAGKKLCNGDVVKTCNADNTVPQDGTPCAKNEICEDGACKPLGCNLDNFFCKGKDIYYCSRIGQQLLEECAAGQACQAMIGVPDGDFTGSSSLTSCRPLSCPPGQTGCVKNQIGPCAASGAGLSAVTTDCAATGTICTRDATCDVSVTDSVGRDESAMVIGANQYVANVINVLSPRKLTELQMWLVFPSPRDLRWVVFELVGSELISRAEKTTTVASSAGFVGSGPLSFDYLLEAGKHYAFGMTMPGDSVGYYDGTEPLPLADSPSFGSIDGIVFAEDNVSSFNIGDGFSAGAAIYMKLTTAAP